MMPSPSDPDLWTIDPSDFDPRDIEDEPEPEVDGDGCECEMCHGPCPSDQVVCDDCEQLVDEMGEEGRA